MSDTDTAQDTAQDSTQDEPNSTTKGRVRRISKKEKTPETTTNDTTHAVNETATKDTNTNGGKDTDTNESESTVGPMDDDTLQAHAEQVATGILDGVLGQSGIVNNIREADNPTAKKSIGRRDLAAARARQMRLNMAREFMKAGKLLSAKQRLLDILHSAPNSSEADAAIELLLELAAHYESLGRTRWALDLYDDIARYD